MTKVSYDVFSTHKDFFLDRYFKECYTYFSFYPDEYSDKEVARCIQLTFYLGNIHASSITDEEKAIVLDALARYGGNSTYISNSGNSLVIILPDKVEIGNE